MRRRLLTAIILLFTSCAIASAQTTAFTYQGRLSDNGTAANGNYDIQFKLFDTATVGTGSQQGPTVTNATVVVTMGAFTVQLDFGAGPFNGQPRFVEIGVRTSGNPNPYIVLTPRQPVSSTPYAVRSLNSSTADVLSSSCVGCVSGAQIGSVSGSTMTGTIPVASVPPGSASYVQNTTNPQASASFNITGDGTAGGTLSANAVNSTNQYNIGGSRAFTVSSFSRNVFAGVSAGAANGIGGGNSFFGHGAGEVTALGANNSFFGKNAGNANTSSSNSFFGAEAGFGNSTGTRNSFFGLSAGRNNLTGSDNAFFGNQAGLNNTTSFNSFFGSNAGNSTTSGNHNAFFGYNAGQSNLTGEGNSFFGYDAGSLTTAGANSFFGRSAGAANTLGDNNAFFGYLTGDSNTTGSQNSFFGFNAGGANTVFTSNSFFGFNSGALTSGGGSNSFFGARSGDVNTSGGSNSFFGTDSGGQNMSGGFNVFVGNSAGLANTTGSNNTLIGSNANVASGNLSFATAIGAGATVSTSNTIVIGRSSDTVVVPSKLNVSEELTANSFVTFNGLVRFNDLGGGGSDFLCLDATNYITASCTSSLRYKDNVQAFLGGLEIVKRLRPITFNWKSGGRHDVGFAAEEVERVEPLLATYNKEGLILGVKYAQITTVLVNSINEQQAMIERQQREIDALKKLVLVSAGRPRRLPINQKHSQRRATQ